MASHVVIFLQASYFLAGIFFADFPCKIFIKLYHILLFACDLCLFTGIAIVSMDKSTFWVVNSYYIAAGVSILKAFCMQRYYHEEFIKLYQYIIGFNKEMKNFSEMSNMFMGKFAVYILFVLINVAMIFVFPVYKLLMTDVSISDVGARVYPSWYPWSTHTATRYTITLIVQIVIVSFVMCQLTFCLTSYIGVTIAVQTGFNCLGNRIVDLENEVLQRIRGSNGDGSGTSTQIKVPAPKQQFDDTLMEVFLDVVKSHQRLNSFTKDAVALFTWIIPDVVVLGVVSSISVPATFMKGSFNLTNKMELVIHTYYSVMAFVICCHCGEIILKSNEIMKQALYNFPWYEQTPAFRKYFITSMMETQKQFYIKIGGMYLLCISYVVSILRVCYTAAQLLSRV